MNNATTISRTHRIERTATSAALFGSAAERSVFQRSARVHAEFPQTAAVLGTTPYIFCTITILSGC